VLRLRRQLRGAIGGARPSQARASGRDLITGPSKTADIEGILITGVHGPGRGVMIIG